MDIAFLGGIFPKHLEDTVFENSNRGIQFAANNLQWNIIKGLDINNDSYVHLCNLMFIGSYPVRYRKICIKTELFSHEKDAYDINIGFNNLSGFKFLSRFLASFRGLYRWSLRRAKNKVVVIYSVHTPFLLASVLVKIFFKRVKLCLIVPDLPEFMSDDERIVYRILKYIDKQIISQCLKKIDAFVVLTKYMTEPLKIRERPWICIEGISNYEIQSLNQTTTNSRKIILYTGTLATRYGILNLIDAFRDIDRSNYELWICGSGDAKETILSNARIDSRIKFLGKIPRDEVLSLQRKATVLINPRTSEGRYTKYSFPSKVIEYLSSGIPTIIHKLPGIPEEYFKYCFVAEIESALGLKETILYACELKQEIREEFGRQAQLFISSNKNPKVQGEKIVKTLNSLFD